GNIAVSFQKERKDSVRGTIVLSDELLRNGLAPLPGTKDEVDAIGKLFSNPVLVTGREMTSAKVEESAKGKSVVHFATHGILDPLHPLFSGLLLSDKILTTVDIFGMEIDSPMVVLSACNTAGGELSKGDEIVGISRAFMYAGSPLVVASLWSVSDESTTMLMKCFYEGVRAGKPASLAMRDAQLKVMEEYPEPFYWAPFVVMGDSGK
ncbi:MAG: CHAT domain-containing protein, partial [Syntrophales bacterium]|nr:CHAT domain-containing protein [Syntrophales bacterium]